MSDSKSNPHSNQQLKNEKSCSQPDSLVLVATPDYLTVMALDPDALPERNANAAAAHLTEVVITIAIAGYEGVDIVESRLPDGRVLSAVSIKPDTPEGRVLEETSVAADAGVFIPAEVVLRAIREAYAKGGRA